MEDHREDPSQRLRSWPHHPLLGSTSANDQSPPVGGRDLPHPVWSHPAQLVCLSCAHGFLLASSSSAIIPTWHPVALLDIPYPGHIPTPRGIFSHYFLNFFFSLHIFLCGTCVGTYICRCMCLSVIVCMHKCVCVWPKVEVFYLIH